MAGYSCKIPTQEVFFLTKKTISRYSKGRLKKNRVGRDQFLGRDREIRLMKIHYETETEKKWMLIF